MPQDEQEIQLSRREYRTARWFGKVRFIASKLALTQDKPALSWRRAFANGMRKTMRLAVMEGHTRTGRNGTMVGRVRLERTTKGL